MFVIVSGGKIFGVFKDFFILCNEIKGWIYDFHCCENFAIDRCDVYCVIAWLEGWTKCYDHWCSVTDFCEFDFWSCISVLYWFYLTRLSATELVDSSSGIWSSFGGVFEVFAVFGCNFWTESFDSFKVGAWVASWVLRWDGDSNRISELKSMVRYTTIITNLIWSWLFK